MRKIYIIILIILIYLCSLPGVYSKQYKWTQVKEKSIELTIRGMGYLDEKNCFALIDDDYIKINKTSNLGETWESVFDGEKNNIYDIFNLWNFEISKEGIFYVIGGQRVLDSITNQLVPKGTISISLDSGKTFTTKYFEIGTQALRKLSMLDSNHGIVSGNLRIYITEDGWETWDHYPTRYSFITDVNYYAKDTIFYSATVKHGYEDIYSGAMMKSTDGGISFDTLHLCPQNHRIHKFTIVDEKYIYAVGDWPHPDAINDAVGALIYKSSDLGETWETVYKGFFHGGELLDVAFIDSLNGIATGQWHPILRTSDGGKTWIQDSLFYENGQEAPRTASLTVDYVGNTPFVGNFSGEIWRLDEVLTSVGSSHNKDDLAIYPNPATSIITIENILPGTEYKIFNTLGIEVLSGIYNENINVANLLSGVYFIQIPSTGETLKFVKE